MRSNKYDIKRLREDLANGMGGEDGLTKKHLHMSDDQLISDYRYIYGDEAICEYLLDKPRFSLGAGSFGNGIIVWDRNRIVHGDYKQLAYIDTCREVTWYIKNPPDHLVKYVKNIVEGENPSVSVSQPEQKVFKK
jgi:hypothetical protein